MRNPHDFRSKRRYSTVYLDMDGVLADFHGGLNRLTGKNIPAERITSMRIWESYGMTEDEMWKLIHAEGPGFWANLPLLPDATRLVALARDLTDAFGKLEILTQPSACPSSITGKQIWLQKFGFHTVKVNFTRTGKGDFAAPGRILIDDFTHNCEAFTERGGDAILVSRPWSAPSRMTFAGVFKPN